MDQSRVEQIAMVAHEANRAYCKSIGDNSQPTWEDAPDWQKESAVNGVQHHIEHPNATPNDSHKNWMAEKEKAGWVYGETKDPEAKTHPCMVPYHKLPLEQRVKDSLFIGVVRGIHGGLCAGQMLDNYQNMNDYLSPAPRVEG